MRSHLLRAWAIISCLTVFGAGCEPLSSLDLPLISQSPVATSTAPSGSMIGWVSYGSGVDRGAFRFSSSTASEIIIYRFAIATHTFGFRHATSGASVTEWADAHPEAIFTANGVYFHEDALPSGWFRMGGEVIGKRAFDLDKSALVTLHPKPGIVTAPATQRSAQQSAQDAAQSYPLLVSKGVAAVKEDSGKVARRTFIGTDAKGTFLYVGIVPYTSISLYELSQALARLPIRWDTVLNLDGGPSSGLRFRGAERSEVIDSYVTVPNVLMVFSK